MIRFFTKLCKTILENIADYDIFIAATASFSHYGAKCQGCGATGNLSPYGSYNRNLVSRTDEETVDDRVSPNRYKCKICDTTHAMLPDIIVPHSQYSLRFKLTALIAYFERDTTVVAVCQSFGIAVSTLYEWKKRLLSHKALLLGALRSLKTSEHSFLSSLLESEQLSKHLRIFFLKYGFSFLQCPFPATRSCPP